MNEVTKALAIKKEETKTSRGMLSKAWYALSFKQCMLKSCSFNTPGSIYLVKGNSSNEFGEIGYEPYSEAMASIIAEMLGLPAVWYELRPASMFPEVKVHGIEHVSICEAYHPRYGEIISFHDFLIGRGAKEPIDYLEEYKKHFKDNLLYHLLAFDALIGNEDRHFGNIEVIIRSDGNYRLAPFYDFGASLLAWYSAADISRGAGVGKFDRAQPFRTTHKVQIKLITEILYDKGDINKFYEVVIEKIDPILQLLSERRANCIRDYLRWRMKYLERVMDKE